MAIRIRTVNGKKIALCAARSIPKEGDLYLDDEIHHALSTKFFFDLESSRFTNLTEDELLIMQEESNNPNRDLWEKMYNSGVELKFKEDGTLDLEYYGETSIT